MRRDAMWKRAWVEVDLDALKENYIAVRRVIPHKTKLCCVVKANAYGHGAPVVAALYETLGADFLAVSNIEEALELRLGGITLPILILGYTAPACAEILARHQISQSVFSKEYAEALSAEAVKAGVCVTVHIKLDSGMGRIGFSVRDEAALCESVNAIEAALALPNLCKEGIFTHFAKSDMGDGGKDFTKAQLDAFLEATARLEKRGITFSIRHAANSAAIFDYPESSLDMVRAGIVLYGYPPSDDLSSPCTLSPALSVKSVVSMVKTVKAGESVSYGGDFVADSFCRIATVPIGYADGLWRSMEKNRLSLSFGGIPTPIVGRICMDQCMIDVSACGAVAVGDTVTVFGVGGESVEALAKRAGTIPYEIVCALGARLPRVYLEHGERMAIRDRILPMDDPE